MTKTYMLSFLARQHLVLGKRFVQRYSQWWLVWEPTAWKVQPLQPSALETQLPDRTRPSTPREADALCFEVVATPGVRFRLGRSELNEIVITDVTVSREHCTLRREGNRWVVTGSPSVKSLMVAGVPQLAGGDASLFSGDGLQLGDVRLTFYDAAGFEKRVAAEAASLTRATGPTAR